MCWDATRCYLSFQLSEIESLVEDRIAQDPFVNFLLFQLLSWLVLLLLRSRVFVYNIYKPCFLQKFFIVEFKDRGSKWNYNSEFHGQMEKLDQNLHQNLNACIYLGNLICHVSCQNSDIFIWIRSVNSQSISVYYCNLKRSKK